MSFRVPLLHSASSAVLQTRADKKFPRQTPVKQCGPLAGNNSVHVEQQAGSEHPVGKLSGTDGAARSTQE
jgi:hypothetical protein